MTAWHVTVSVLSRAILPSPPTYALTYIHKVNIRQALLEKQQQVIYLCCPTALFHVAVVLEECSGHDICPAGHGYTPLAAHAQKTGYLASCNTYTAQHSTALPCCTHCTAVSYQAQALVTIQVWWQYAMRHRVRPLLALSTTMLSLHKALQQSGKQAIDMLEHI